MDQPERKRGDAAKRRAVRLMAGKSWIDPEAGAGRVFDDPAKARRYAKRKARQASAQAGQAVVYHVVKLGDGKMFKACISHKVKPETSHGGFSVKRSKSPGDDRLLAELNDQLLEMVSERNRFLSRLAAIEARIDARLAGGSQ